MTTSDRKSKETRAYRLLFHPDALIEWRDLDGSVSKPLKKILARRLVNPRVPGSELGRGLAGCYKIKLRKQGIRLVYTVQDSARSVTVMAVGKREDDLIYRFAVTRLP